MGAAALVAASFLCLLETKERATGDTWALILQLLDIECFVRFSKADCQQVLAKKKTTRNFFLFFSVQVLDV